MQRQQLGSGTVRIAQVEVNHPRLEGTGFAAENRRSRPRPTCKEVGRRPSERFRMPGGAVRTAEQRKRRAETERRRYTKKRVAELRALLPELPDGSLAELRQLSVAVRRAGAKQSALVSFSQVESSSGTLSNDQPLCVDSAAVDARGAP